MASIFTGTYPATHGVSKHESPYVNELPMFTRTFAENGYFTMAYVANVGVTPRTGFGHDFNHFSIRRKFAGDAALVDLAIEGIEGAAGRPWFAYVHLMGAHSPYDPPDELWDRYQPEGQEISREELLEVLLGARVEGLGKQAQLAKTEGSDAYKVRGVDERPLVEDLIDPDRLKAIIEALYDAELRNTDAQFQRIIDTLKAQGEYENTLIVILADHGEGFWEHGVTHHGNSLYGELVDAPLIVKRPGIVEGRTIDSVVEHVDMPTTITELAGLTFEWPHQGQSLLPLIDGTVESIPRIGRSAMAKTVSPRSIPIEADPGILYYFRSLNDGRHKMILNDATGSTQYYDIVADPGEQQPLEAPPEGIEAFEAVLAEMGRDKLPGLTVMLSAPHGEKTTFTGTIRGAVPDAMFFRAEFPGRHIERDGDGWRFVIEIDGREDIPYAAPYYNPIMYGDMAEDTEVTIELAVNGEPLEGEQVALGGRGKAYLPEGGTFVPSEYPGIIDTRHPAYILERPSASIWYTLGGVTPQEQLDVDEETADELRALGYL